MFMKESKLFQLRSAGTQPENLLSLPAFSRQDERVKVIFMRMPPTFG